MKLKVELGEGGRSRSGVIRWKVCPPAVRVLKYGGRVTRSINGKSLWGNRRREKRKKNSIAATARDACRITRMDE